MNYSKGPWEIIKHSWSRLGIQASNGHIAYLDIYDKATEENQEDLESEMMANAQLISAAPELLAALKLCCLVLGGNQLSKSALTQALLSGLAAINKVEGKGDE